MAEGHFDHLVDAGLLPESFRGRLSPEEERRRAIRAVARARLAATAEPEPTLPIGTDAIGTMAAEWAANPDRAPFEIAHSIRNIRAFAELALMQGPVPDDPTIPPSSEDQSLDEGELDDADP